MGFKYFCRLYWRNFKGTFLGGFVGISGYVDGDPIDDLTLPSLLWLGHILLLPVSLSFGAGIKTIIDYCTRKSTPEEVVMSSLTIIAQLDKDTDSFQKILTTIREAQPQSNSSKQCVENCKENKKPYKEYITGYLNNPDNNGKKLFQTIVAAIQENNKKAIEAPSAVCKSAVCKM